MLNQDYSEMLSALLAEKVKFVLVGAYALATYGIMRATADIDIFVEPSKENAEKILKALAIFGVPQEHISSKDFEIPGTILQIGVAPRRIDLITEIDGVSFNDAWKDKNLVSIDNLSVPVISKTLLIKNKMASRRPKDKLDAEALNT